MRINGKSVLGMLVKCPHCGEMYVPGIEGRKDGTMCDECAPSWAAELEPKVNDWDGMTDGKADAS